MTHIVRDDCINRKLMSAIAIASIRCAQRSDTYYAQSRNNLFSENMGLLLLLGTVAHECEFGYQINLPF